MSHLADDPALSTAPAAAVFVPRRLDRAAVRHLERRIAEHGHATIVLQTGARQTAALALYDRLGYRPLPAGADRSWDPYVDEELSTQLWKHLPSSDADRALS